MNQNDEHFEVEELMGNGTWAPVSDDVDHMNIWARLEFDTAQKAHAYIRRTWSLANYARVVRVVSTRTIVEEG